MSDRLILEELARRKAATRAFKLEDYLFDKQLEFVRDPSSFKVAVTTRRSGKSTSCVADLIATALETSNISVLYITLSRKNAKRLVWKEFKKLNKEYRLNGEVNESDLTLTFPNGSTLYLSGASDKSDIENFRGMALKKVYVDECQSFPDYIRELIDDVLGPALMDYNGTLCLIGTPGPIPAGFFYEISQDKGWSRHFWSFFDNPYIAIKSGCTHQELLTRELTRRGVSAQDPSVQREWYGQWVLDTDSLVYKFDNEKSVYENLPREIAWSYILGVDLGFDDADALAVLAWSDKSPTAYLVEERITRHQGITELVDQIAEIKSKYDISKIVVDTAGLGKKIAEELSRRYRLSVQPAEKARKFEYIELMNDALRTGALQAKSHSRFAQDCTKVEYDRARCTPDKLVISSRFHSDICEAVLYAWREVYSYTYQSPVTHSLEGSKAWLDDLERQAEEHFKALESLKLDPDGLY
jgi:hypothetical protein